MRIDLSMDGSLTGAAGLAWWSLGGGRDGCSQGILVEEKGFELWKGQGDNKGGVRCIGLERVWGARLRNGFGLSFVCQSLDHELRVIWSDPRW